MGIVIGGGAPKRLPDAYVEVEYIESSGTQYINTGRTPGSEYCKVEANVTPYRPAWNSYGALFGMCTSGDDRFALKVDDSNLWRVDLGENPLTWTDMTVSPGSNVDIRMVGDNRDTELVIGGVTCTMFSGYYPTIVQSTRPMYIFAYNEDGTATSLISMKLYSFKIYSSSSTLARDFVPCYRVSDSVIGLYDLVGGQFYTNAGTGVFTKGNDVQTAIDVLDIRYGRSNDYTPLMGPSPTGFHVPTKDEWKGLKNIMRGLSLDTGSQWRTKLHIPLAGWRKYDGTRQNQGTYGTYWSSSPYLYSSAYSYYLYLTSSGADASSNYNGRAYGRSVRCFKDTYATPDSSWTVVEGTLGNAGIFRDQTNGLISVTDGSKGYTIMDKNLGATTVYNDGDTLSETNCGKYYQWGNNYGFPRTGSMTTSSTQVDGSGYGPGNYYSNSTYITNSSNPYDWSSVRNDNLWGYRDYSKPPKVKKIMMRPNNVETQVRPTGWQPGVNTIAYWPLNSTTTTNDMKGGTGTMYNLTTNGSGGSFGTNYWDNTSSSYLRTSISFPGFSSGDSFYFGLRFYRTGTETSGGLTVNGRLFGLPTRGYYIIIMGNPGNNTGLDFNEPQYGHEGRTTITQQVPLNKWVYIYYTGTVGQSNGIGGMIIDGVEYNTPTITPLATSAGQITLGTNGNTGYTDGRAVGRFSEAVVEDKFWTSQERLDYYNLTKGNYGIS